MVLALDGVLWCVIWSTSASQDSWSLPELVLYQSSVNRGPDNCYKCEPKNWELGNWTLGVSGLGSALGTVGTGVSCILLAYARGGVGWALSSVVSITDDALEGGHAPTVGPVMDCEGVGLSGWDNSADVCTGVSGCNWPKPCASLVGCWLRCVCWLSTLSHPGW